MTVEQKLKAAEIIANCKLVEALPYVMNILNVERAEVEVIGNGDVDIKIKKRNEQLPKKCRDIRELMEAKGITDNELELRCHSSRSTINRYKNGTTVPSEWRYKEIMNVLEEM